MPIPSADPFGDPWNPARAMVNRGPRDTEGVPPSPPHGAGPDHPLTPEEREDVEADLADLVVYRLALEPRGVLGLAVDCVGCDATHYFSWGLVRGNLEAVLASSESDALPVHEPACNPATTRYVTWEYARGFVDGLLAGSAWEDTTTSTGATADAGEKDRPGPA